MKSRLWIISTVLVFCLSQAVIIRAEAEPEPVAQTEAVTVPVPFENEESARTLMPETDAIVIPQASHENLNTLLNAQEQSDQVPTTESQYLTTLMAQESETDASITEPSTSTSTTTTTTSTTIPSTTPASTTSTTESSTTSQAVIATSTTTTPVQSTLVENIRTSPKFVELQLLNRENQLRRDAPEPDFHSCTTSMSCPDPNAHCVNINERNVCVCRLNFELNRNSGLCEPQAPPTSTTWPATSAAHPSDETDNEKTLDHNVSSTEHEVRQAHEYAVSAARLTPAELRGVITMTFRTAMDAVQWIVEFDAKFKQTIVDIIKTTNFTLTTPDGHQRSIALSIAPSDIIYIAPTPRATPDGLVVSFMIQDRAGISQVNFNDLHAINVRRKRNSSRPTSLPLPVFPAQWILPALQAARPLLNTLLGINLLALQSGVPSDLLATERMVNMTLFERHLDIFVALIFLAAFCSLALALGLACIKARARKVATWDPPAGYVYEKARKPLHSAHAESLEGQDLAPDALCKEGEDQRSVDKQSTIPGPRDDDGWVVPYDEVMRTSKVLHTQVVDTRQTLCMCAIPSSRGKKNPLRNSIFYLKIVDPHCQAEKKSSIFCFLCLFPPFWLFS